MAENKKVQIKNTGGDALYPRTAAENIVNVPGGTMNVFMYLNGYGNENQFPDPEFPATPPTGSQPCATLPGFSIHPGLTSVWPGFFLPMLREAVQPVCIPAHTPSVRTSDNSLPAFC